MPVLLLAFMSTQAMSFSGNVGILFSIPRIALDAKADFDGDRVNRLDRVERVENLTRGADFVISKFDQDMIKEFGNAWRSSGNGTTDVESVVLILRMVGGGFKAVKQGSTNEHRKFTFRWHPATIAVVHTHPNDANPKPKGADCQIADKYGVPIFTITAKGMYVYDPYTKKTTLIQNGLDWLDLSSWPQE
jgi:hypothetical protein